MARSTRYTALTRVARREAILEYVKQYHKTNNVVPTITEIGNDLGFSYTDVWRLMQQMFAERVLIQNPSQVNKHRAYTLPQERT